MTNNKTHTRPARGRHYLVVPFIGTPFITYAPTRPELSSSVTRVFGPFRTKTGAEAALKNPSIRGYSVSRIEKMARDLVAA